MADWTVILTTVGAAGLTGGFGYFSARWQGRVALDQAQMENERLRIQHREDHLRNRQGTYHALLTADQELASAFGQGIGEAQEAFEKFSHLGNGAVLFGTDAVKDAITAVLGQYVEIFREALKRAGNKPVSPAEIRAVFKERTQQIGAARTALVEAMREDVGP